MNVQFNLDYRKYPTNPSSAFPQNYSALRPAIPIKLINQGRQISYIALIDSGADFCVFHAEIGEQIGLDIESGKKLDMSGITGTQFIAYFQNIRIEIGGHGYDCYAGFTREFQDMPYGVLGQVGFFDHFKLTFEYTKERIELKSIN